MQKKPVVVLLAVLIIGLLFPSIRPAWAEEILFLSPTRVTMDDQKKVAVVNVTNLSDVGRTYTVQTNNIVMTAGGTTTEVDNFDYSARRMIRFFPREFTIAPGQRQTIRIMARFPEGTADGDYHCHINFEEDIKKRGQGDPENKNGKGKVGISAPISYSALIPVIVSHGKVDAKISMKGGSVKKSDKNPQEYVFSTTLNRSGNAQGTALFEFIYQSPDGKAVPMGKKSTVYIYRELDTRTYSYNFKLPEGAKPGGKLDVILHDGRAPEEPVIQKETFGVPG